MTESVYKWFTEEEGSSVYLMIFVLTKQKHQRIFACFGENTDSEKSIFELALIPSPNKRHRLCQDPGALCVPAVS
jgi:hypothetical protein